jgi:hypothetical protein
MPMFHSRGMTDQAREARRHASVVNHEGTRWNIGSAVRFLLSDQPDTLPVTCWSSMEEPRLSAQAERYSDL